MAQAKASLPCNKRVPSTAAVRGKMGQGDVVLGKKKISTDFDEKSEYSDLAEKVFQNINATFDRDEFLDEFDIIPVESKSNHSPVLHEESEHKIAIESWCVPYLYTHSYKSFLAIRRKQRPSSSSSSTSLNNKYGSSKVSTLSEPERIQRGLLLTRTIVLLNPDLTMAWNFRRDHIPLTTRDNFDKELKLISLVATRKPKCSEGFCYRKWLVRKALENELLKVDTISEWTAAEIAAIEIPILKYFSNYHAWNYRLWLIETILGNSRVPEDQKVLVLEKELICSNKWMCDHVSDYCGHHYRQKLFECMEELKVGTESQESRLMKELQESERRIELYEGHETQWYHRRFIVHKLIASGAERYVQNEERDLMEGITTRVSEVSKECSQLNYNLGVKHLKWLEKRFNWDLGKLLPSNPIEL